jgi:hypothetical protein
MESFGLNMALEGCRTSIERINEAIDDFEKRLKRSKTFGRLKVVMDDGELKKVVARLEREKSTLILSVQIYMKSVYHSCFDPFVCVSDYCLLLFREPQSTKP